MAWAAASGRIGSGGVVIVIADIDGCLDLFGLQRDGEIGRMGRAYGET